jgi:hypothetical protein
MLIITNTVEQTKQHLPSVLIKTRFKMMVEVASHP